MPKPDLAAVPSFYHRYIQQVVQDNLLPALNGSTVDTTGLLKSLSLSQWDHAYAPGKWTIKEVAQHLIDAERIFCYRALCIARGERAPLPGFDENDYAAASKAANREPRSLLQEFDVVRRGTAALFASFDDEQLSAAGTANSGQISVSAIGFIIAGHTQHHLRIVKERYL